MADRTAWPGITLPKHWPCRLRSAIVHAVSLANAAMAVVRGRAEHHVDARVRLQAEANHLRREIALLQEELRIKDARMEKLPPQQRPHYPPVERLAILELRAARAWSLAETARRLMVAPLTVASWMKRLDDEGPKALVQTREPVNRFPDFVAYMVRRLKVLCPAMGSRRIARVLARAGLHLGATTVRRMIRTSPKPAPRVAADGRCRVVTAKTPNHVWHVDLTTVPTSLGFWIPWVPMALPQRWPFCWWVAVAVDHFSRRVMGTAVFPRQPSAQGVIGFLDRAIGQARSAPCHIVTDHGRQFTARGFRRWCRRRNIRQRFGAIGKYGSLAAVERFIRSLKNECTRRILVPFDQTTFERELAAYGSWFNVHGPHERLGGASPDEIYHRLRRADRRPRYEPRSRWPRSSPCAFPQALVRGRPGAVVGLEVEYRDGRAHLPVVSLARIA